MSGAQRQPRQNHSASFERALLSTGLILFFSAASTSRLHSQPVCGGTYENTFEAVSVLRHVLCSSTTYEKALRNQNVDLRGLPIIYTDGANTPVRALRLSYLWADISTYEDTDSFFVHAAAIKNTSEFAEFSFLRACSKDILKQQFSLTLSGQVTAESSERQTLGSSSSEAGFLDFAFAGEKLIEVAVGCTP